MKVLDYKKWLLSLGLLLSITSYAEEVTDNDIPVISPLATEVEFGYQAYSGNSDSESLNARFSVEYKAGRYRSTGEWKYFMLYKDDLEERRQSTYQAQVDYKLGAKSYLYGSFKRIDSKHSAYFKNYTLSSGLGYQFSYTKRFVFELELGPGFRYQEPNLSKIGKKDIIFSEKVEEVICRANVNTTWQALDNLSLSANLTIVSGKSNTQTDTVLSATNNITESIALKLSHSSQYYNKVPDGLNKQDSIFSVNLLFLF
ncbi:DUF481 domain-containing protein [Photobacterium sagamiensis]|uniref:DUF481 domain-containing protein n=1 Tax=Photobacterium sagamiensis TaxID=2910241 RepID=UPI003D1476DF